MTTSICVPRDIAIQFSVRGENRANEADEDILRIIRHPRNAGLPAGYPSHHFTDLTESGVKRTALHPETSEHITSARRTRRAELPAGKATWKPASDSARSPDLSLSEPLMNSTLSTFGPGLKSRKNSAVAVPGTRRLSLMVRSWLNSLPFGSRRSRSIAVGDFAPVKCSRRRRVSSHVPPGAFASGVPR